MNKRPHDQNSRDEKPAERLKRYILQHQPMICQLMPRGANVNKIFASFLFSVTRTPELIECEPLTILGALMRCAELGLSLDTQSREAWLIPRKDKKLRDGRKRCEFQIGYMGARKLALQGDDDLVDIYAFVVRKGDDFRFNLGLRPDLQHVPSLDESREITHAYAVGVWKGDYRRFIVIDSTDIAKARATSQYDTIWSTYEAEMWRKTVLIRFCKTLQFKSELEINDDAQEDPYAVVQQIETRHAGVRAELHAARDSAFDFFEGYVAPTSALDAAALRNERRRRPVDEPPVAAQPAQESSVAVRHREPGED
jgi:recombination protein RecT